MSWIAVREAWKLDLPPTEKFVLLAIADFSNDKKGVAWPSQSTIARKTGYTRQTVNRAINRLREKKMIVSSRRSAEGKSTSNEYRITIVTQSDVQANNVAQNDNHVSNSATNQCNGELHKPLPTLNEPLKQNADPITKDDKTATTNSGPPKTPQDFLALKPSIQEWYSLHKPQLMSELSAKGLVGDRFVGWSHR
jgi:DNA-binding transcriptional MocR family regulator